MIDVFTFITRNCSKHAELLHSSLEFFKSHDIEINYKAIESIKAEYWPKQWEFIEKTGNYNHGSISHAVAIHTALRHVKSEYCLLIDADICILHKNWDKIIIDESNKYDAFGLGYAKIGYNNYHFY